MMHIPSMDSALGDGWKGWKLLYDSAAIRSDPALADVVNPDGDTVFNETAKGEPYIDPFDIRLQIGFSGTNPPPSTEPVATTVGPLLPGRHIRVVLLAEPSTSLVIQKVQDGIGRTDGGFNDTTYTNSF